MLKKYAPYFGIAAPILYVFATLLGGAIRPGYSHIAHAISELTEAGAPNKGLLDILYILYNVLLTLFGLGVAGAVKARASVRKSGMIGASLLVLVGVLGLLMSLFFPMDPRGAAPTLTGTGHLVLAGLLSLGTILSTLLTGLWMRKEPDLKHVGTYTLITFAVILLSGGMAAGTAATGSPIMGLAERITIGAFMQWVFVLAVRLRKA